MAARIREPSASQTSAPAAGARLTGTNSTAGAAVARAGDVGVPGACALGGYQPEAQLNATPEALGAGSLTPMASNVCRKPPRHEAQPKRQRMWTNQAHSRPRQPRSCRPVLLSQHAERGNAPARQPGRAPRSRRPFCGGAEVETLEWARRRGNRSGTRRPQNREIEVQEQEASKEWADGLAEKKS